MIHTVWRMIRIEKKGENVIGRLMLKASSVETLNKKLKELSDIYWYASQTRDPVKIVETHHAHDVFVMVEGDETHMRKAYNIVMR